MYMFIRSLFLFAVASIQIQICKSSSNSSVVQVGDILNNRVSISTRSISISIRVRIRVKVSISIRASIRASKYK